MIYSFEPKQDLNGYDKPWAPGDGVNKLPTVEAFTEESNGITITSDGKGVYTFSGTSTSAVSITKDLDDAYTFPAGNMYLQLHNDSANGGVVIVLLDDDNTQIVNRAATNVNQISAAISQEDKTITKIRFYVGNGTTISAKLTMSPALVNTSTATAFSPYSNICPLEGYECIPDDSDYMVYAGYVNSQTGELYMRPYYPEYDGAELVGPWMSSMDAYEEGETPTSGAQVVDLGGDLYTSELPRFMLQTLLRSLGIIQNFGSRTLLLNSLLDQATGRVREDDDLLDGLRIHIIGDVLPGDLIIKPGKPVKFTKEDL